MLPNEGGSNAGLWATMRELTITSLAVDANALTSILHAHDPLDVLSKWALIRGQIEPRVWAEIDILLDEIAVRAAAQNAEKVTPET